MIPHEPLPDDDYDGDEVEYIDHTMSLLAQGAMPMAVGDNEDDDTTADHGHRDAVSLIDRLIAILTDTVGDPECDDDDEERLGVW